MKTNDTCDMLRRGGSCYLSDLRLLKLRSQTHHWKLEGGDLKTKHTHTHTHTQKKPEVLHISETMEPENWGKELDWPVWYRAEQFTKFLHIQTVLFVAYTFLFSG